MAKKTNNKEVVRWWSRDAGGYCLWPATRPKWNPDRKRFRKGSSVGGYSLQSFCTTAPSALPIMELPPNSVVKITCSKTKMCFGDIYKVKLCPTCMCGGQLVKT